MKRAVIRDGWALCPEHWAKLARVEKTGSGVLYLWCKRCREEIQLVMDDDRHTEPES